MTHGNRYMKATSNGITAPEWNRPDAYTKVWTPDSYLQALHYVWMRTDAIFGSLRDESVLYSRPIRLRLPLLFYVGHMHCFTLWTLNYLFKSQPHTIDKRFDQLFQRGIDPIVSSGLLTHSSSAAALKDDVWSKIQLSDLRQYVKDVRNFITTLVKDGTLDFSDELVQNLLSLDIEHQMMHHETTLYILHQLSTANFDANFDMSCRDGCPSSYVPPLIKPHWVKFSGTDVILGQKLVLHDKHNVPIGTFGFDNEFPCETRKLSPYSMMNRPINNAEYLLFVMSGAYTKSQWWEPDIFEWISAHSIRCPQMWHWNDTTQQYTVDNFDCRNRPFVDVATQPVICCQAEGAAFCRWYSAYSGRDVRLPSEAEWINSIWNNGFDASSNRSVRNGSVAAESDGLFWDGWAWEWTSDIFKGFKDFQHVMPSYKNYSSDFFDGQHVVCLGGSWATEPRLMRRTFRNWYQKNYRYSFATFRMASSYTPPDGMLLLLDSAVTSVEASKETLGQRKQAVDELVHGLTASPRRIESKYLYDTAGSALYSQIIQLDEYYLARTENRLLARFADRLSEVLVKSCLNIHSLYGEQLSSRFLNMIELGCGDGSKTINWLQPLLSCAQGNPACSPSTKIIVRYMPIDISSSMIDTLFESLEKNFNTAVNDMVFPLVASFDDALEQRPWQKQSTDFELPLSSVPPTVNCMLLLGSTIGNFSSYVGDVRNHPESPACKLIYSIRNALNVGDYFLCAFDLCKPPSVLVPAYFDAKGVTSAFNYNVLVRLNRELGTNFDVACFEHYALYNPSKLTMESWLVSKCKQTISNGQGLCIDFVAGESLHTEISSKYTLADIDAIMSQANFTVVQHFVDDEFPYTLSLVRAIN